MEDIRTYRSEEDEQWQIAEEDRIEWKVSPTDDEVPFHIPRD